MFPSLFLHIFPPVDTGLAPLQGSDWEGSPPVPGTLASYLREQRLEKPSVFCVAASLLPQVSVAPVPRRQAPHGLGTA